MGELEMRSLIFIVLLLLVSCGKNRSREQIIENIKVLEVAKAEATDPVIQNTIEVAIQENKKELQHDDKIKKAIREFQQDHGRYPAEED
jgi:predicted nucleic-acid-binding protein